MSDNTSDSTASDTKKKSGPNLGLAVAWVPIGVAIGVAIDNIPMGAAIGGVMGFVFGGLAYVAHAKKNKG